MISLRRNVYVLALFELQLTLAADDICDALHNYPVLATTRVTLKTQTSARFHFKSFDFVAFTLFQH